MKKKKFRPLEAQSNSLILYAGFQKRDGQQIETERTFVNFVQLAHRGREKRKKYPFVNLASCLGKTNRKARSPR